MLNETLRARLSEIALNAFRIVFGLMLMQHGAMKLFAMFGRETPVELFSQFGLAGVLEFWVALLVVVGLFTRTSAFFLSGLMAVAYFKVHFPKGWFPIENGGELAALNAFGFLLLAFGGGGTFSLDGWRARRKKEPARRSNA